MLKSVFAIAVVASLAVAACGSPKQAEVPDVEGGSTEDMSTGNEGAPAAGATASPTAAPEGDKGDMRAKCCESCKEGMAKDRSGSDPKTVPCADFTDTLSPWCLEHFRSKPAMAADCS